MTLESGHNCHSYDVIGDVAIIHSWRESGRSLRALSRAIVESHRNVKTVLVQSGPVQGKFRTRKLRHTMGERKTNTIHREAGCVFSVDLAKCYFSPRLSYERLRIASKVKSDETIVNMFAGVGCFSILIAKESPTSKIYSVDLNPTAVKYMCENVKVNGVYGRVIPILGDSKDIVTTHLQHVADRVLMPLLDKALEYLPAALIALKRDGGWIHYYDSEHASKDEDPVEKARFRVANRLHDLKADFIIPFGRIVRTIGPNWYQLALDIRVNKLYTRMPIR